MKHFREIKIAVLLLVAAAMAVPAQAFDWTKLASGAAKLAQAGSISDQDLAQYVAKGVQEMDAKNTVLGPNDPYTQRLARLTKGMTDANGIALNFKVYKTTEVNAFACPDGSVRVYSGIMDLLNDDELIGVIGHEIGHVALRHSKEAYKKALERSALNDAAGAVSSTYAAVSSSFVGDLLSSAMSAGYSRKQESAADDYGYDFLKSHGRNPWAMAMAFEKMKKLESGSSTAGNALLGMFSDHPSTDKRIKAMSKRAKADGYKRPTETEVQTQSTTATTKAGKSTKNKKGSTSSKKKNNKSGKSKKKSKK